jgi:hypothetical protein
VHHSALSPSNERFALADVGLNSVVCLVSLHQLFRAEDSQSKRVTVWKRAISPTITKSGLLA